MKKLNILFLIIAITFSTIACSTNESSYENNPENTETRGIQGTKTFGNKFINNDNNYLLLNLDGTFEASFDGDEIIVGTWTKENDGKILKLLGKKSNEGKGSTFSKNYTILEHTDDIIVLIDSNGDKIEMKSE